MQQRTSSFPITKIQNRNIPQTWEGRGRKKKGFPSGISGKKKKKKKKNLPANAGDRLRFDPWIENVPCRREWQSTPIFLPEESHEQKSLVSYS